MSRIQRRIFLRGAIVGALLTITVISLDLGGFLAPTENWLYDLRARHFQFATKPPCEELVHVDIDDRALDITGVGTWPWPRAKLAAILDEMRIAGVKAVGLDIIYPDAQDPRPTTQPASQPSTAPAEPLNDAALAEAIRRQGSVVVPASMSLDLPDRSPVYKAFVEQLRADPSLEEEEIVRRLEATSLDRTALEHRDSDVFISARRQAMFERISAELAAKPQSREALRAEILKITDTSQNMLTAAARVFEQQYDRWQSSDALRRLTVEMPAGAPSMPVVSLDLPPVPVLANAAQATAFVDYKTARDGVLRSVPLVANLNGRLVPQMGLSLALVTLGLSPADIRFGERSLVVPRKDGGQITIPIHDEYSQSQQRTIATMMDIPWFGGAEWVTMYDWPLHREPAHHVAIGLVWGAYETQQKIANNDAIISEVMPDIIRDVGNPPEVYLESQGADVDPTERKIVAVLRAADDWKQLIGPPEEYTQDVKNTLMRLDALRRVRAQKSVLTAQLRDLRQDLARRLGGKSVLVGWTAIGRLDVLPTSVQPKCPGVVAHGVIFNAIMTQGFWKRVPEWVTTLITLALGLIVVLLATWMSPFWGLMVTVLLGTSYVFINGYFLFDKHNLIVGMAGPLAVLGTVWAGCTINRTIIEAGERARITRRFSTYADPTLVNYILEHPDQVRLEGEKRELTVVFTDLAGFTTLSEQLGERTVALLNEYFGLMMPIISAQKGYVNKFLGDGIMFFFGAPPPNSGHALQAVQSVLEMQVACARFSDDLVRRGLPRIIMRAGITTGEVLVGDAGPADRRDYTVLGDSVNLAARLESANKVTGSSVLINDRTAELVRDRFLLRPIARLQVKGKAIPIMTFEVIASTGEANDRQKQLVQLTAAMVDAYIAADFQRCLAAADELEKVFGASPLSKLYRAQSQHHLQNPDPGFDGRIELKEK